MQGRLKMLRFDTIRSNRYDSCPLMSSRDTGSRFVGDLENIAHLGYAEVGNVAIRHDSIESIRFVSFNVDSGYRKSICASLRKYSASASLTSGSADRLRANRVES